MGTLRGLERSPVAVEIFPSSASVAATTEVFSDNHRVCSGDVGQKSYCSLHGEVCPESSFLGAQSEFHQEEEDSGLVQPESEHTLSFVQDDLCVTGTAGGTSRRLADVSRSERRLLAHPNCELLPEISSFFGKRGDLCLSSDAIRLEHSPSRVHEVVSRSGGLVKKAGVDSLRLSGRLADCGRISSGVTEGHPSRPTSSPGCGLLGEPSKVKPCAYTVHQVVGMDLGHAIGQSHIPSREIRPTQTPSKRVRWQDQFLKTRSGEIGRENQLCLPIGPDRENSPKSGEYNPGPTGKTVYDGYTDSHGSKTEFQLKTLAMDEGVSPYKTIGRAPSIHQDRVRCLKPRLGVSDVPRTHGTRTMVNAHSQTPYKPPGVLGGVHSFEKSGVAEGDKYLSRLGQHECSQLSHKRRFLKVTTIELLDIKSTNSRGEKGMVHFPSTHQGFTKCMGRLSFSPESGFNRVVSGREFVQLAHESPPNSPPRGRPLCHAVERETSILRDPGRGRVRSWNGCSDSLLEPLEGPVSLPSSAFDFEGFEEVRRIQRPDSILSPLVAQESLVPQTQEPLPSHSEVPSPCPVAGGGEQDVLRAALLDERLTRMDFLALCYNRLHKGSLPQYLLSSLRPSSYRQYESVWVKFRTYARRMQPHPINLDLVLNFLIFCFKDKGWQVRTLMPYKSALAEPLDIALDLNLNHKYFVRVFRSMFIKTSRGTIY